MLPSDVNLNELAARLGSVEHFQGLTLEELQGIVRAGVIRRAAAGQTIFVQDDSPVGMYVLISGQVQICKLSPGGKISILTIVNPVTMFNEVAALDGGPNPVTAIANGDCLLWQLDPAGLSALILRFPRIALGMLHVLAARNRHLIDTFEDLSFRSVMARSAKLLLEISADGRQPIDRRRHPNHQLASRVATAPEAFSRTLKLLKTSGDISATPGQIVVLNPTRLRCLAELDPLEKKAA